MANGLAGITLRINLTDNKIQRLPTDGRLMRQWYGGRGVVSKIIYDEVPRDADPLGEQNVLVVSAGILSGCFIPGGSKVEFGSISPLTNLLGDSNMGGHFGPAMKFAGYDLLIIGGISKKPVYLYIDNENVELRDASNYWGMGSLDAESQLKQDLGEDFEIATIGPAAENGILFSCISHDYGRQAGRTGQGAVMGSKKLKAIVVRGNRSIHVHDLSSLSKHVMGIIGRTKEHPNMIPWQKYGTSFFMKWSNDNGVMPTHNFQTTYYEDIDKVDGEQLIEKCLVNHKACFGCWMNCGKYSKVSIPGKPAVFVEGPEYETGALCGPNLGMKDITHVAYINWMCDNLGMDTMSTGGVIGFAMECFEKGLITESEMEGHSLKWGSLDDIEHFLNMVVNKRGIGALFALGTMRAAGKIKGGSEKFAMQVKGQEMSGYDGRWAPGMALSYMTADIGAHHNRSWAITTDIAEGRESVEGRAKIIIYLQHIRPLFDVFCICRLFWGELDVTLEEIIETLNYVTGWDVTSEEALKTSERIWNLNRCHFLERNRKNGRDFDYPPARTWEEKIPTGPGKGKGVTYPMLEQMLDDYYAGRGWDKQGNPTREVLEDLGLGFAVQRLEEIGLIGKPIPGGIPSVRGEKYKPKAF